jgi:hypothetical protein
MKLPISGALALLCAAASGPGVHAEDFPQAEISNGLIHARLYLPDAQRGYYRATRFDWSGSIASLEYQGHSYFGVWFPNYDPKLNDSIPGPVEEFRTGSTTPGYDDARPGGTFLRIGVGVLRKPEEPRFNQFETYEIVDSGRWSVETAPDSVTFTHEVADPASGYAYLYRKTVRLVKGAPQMAIEHSLKNTGRRALETNVYNHQFFMLDGQPTGPDVVVRFPFEPKPAADFHGLAEIRGNELRYLKELEQRQSAASDLAGFGVGARDFDLRVENRKTGAGVRVTGDQPLWKLYFWSIRTTVCPEAYVNLKIEPGRESRWRLLYDFYTVPPPAAQ